MEVRKFDESYAGVRNPLITRRDSFERASLPRLARRLKGQICQMLMGIEIRVFLVIDAFSRFSGTLIACSAALFLQLAKQPLDSTAAASGRGRASVGAGVTAGP